MYITYFLFRIRHGSLKKDIFKIKFYILFKVWYLVYLDKLLMFPDMQKNG